MWLNAIDSEKVDKPAKSIANMEQIFYAENENLENTRHAFENRNIAKVSRIRKEGCLPQVPAENLRALQPLPSSHLFQRYHELRVESYREIQTIITLELSLTFDEVINFWIDKKCRKKLSFLDTLETGTFVFSLRSRFSANWFFFGWDQYKTAIFYLHTPLITASMKIFSAYDVLDLVNNSDKNDSIHLNAISESD